MKEILRPLNIIAAEILTLWSATISMGKPKPGYVVFSLPYVEGLLSMRSCKDRYGLEYGDMMVARALNNLSHWRGPDAARIKAELKQHLKEYNYANH